MLRRSRATPGTTPAPTWIRRVHPGQILAAAVLGALAVSAAIADSQAPASSIWLTVVDLAVALAFILAGALAPGPTLQRVFAMIVGAAWMLGSLLPGTRLAHQAALALMLLAFPAGRPRGLPRVFASILVVPLATGLLPQPAVAATLVVIAAAVFPHRMRPVAGWFPPAAALAVATVLIASWSLSRQNADSFNPMLALLSYEGVLILVAIGYLLAARAIAADTSRLTDVILTDAALSGLNGLAVVLADTLGDPSLRVYRWRGEERGYRADDDSRPDPSASSRQVLPVTEGAEPIAIVEHRDGVLDDPLIAQAVGSAVRSAVVRLRLTEDLQVQLAELEAAGVRILSAADRQREATAGLLRGDVLSLLEQGERRLRDAAAASRDSQTTEVLTVALQELVGAKADIRSLLAGVPTVPLGGGRLAAAITELTAHRSIPVTIASAPDASADADTETVLFYVCAEALANAEKHSSASRIDISLTAGPDGIALRIVDDGVGGADASGSGLQGLADRVAALGGQLEIVSPRGAGTTVIARA